MSKKYFYIFGALGTLALIGAQCVGEQKTITSPEYGSASSTVQITEYFDYQCPACKNAESAVIPFVYSDYVDTGKVKFVYKNLSFIGPESRQAAIAALCAAEQGKFKEYHSKLYASQGGENSGAFKDDKLKGFAKDLGLDTASFDACLDNQRYRSQVIDETRDGQSAGVNATPTYIINGQIVQGGTYLSVKRVIDKKLEEAGK